VSSAEKTPPRIIGPREIHAETHVANYHTDVRPYVWGPRTIPDYELILILSGDFSYSEPGSGLKINLSEGDVLCIPPGMSHLFVSEAGGKRKNGMSCIHLEPWRHGCRLKGDYVTDPEPKLVVSGREDALLLSLFHSAAELFSGHGKNREALVDATAGLIWLRMTELWRAGEKPLISARLRAMMDFISANTAAPLTRRSLAEKFRVTPEHVNAVFKKELGVTPGDFIAMEKVLAARAMIMDGGLSVKEAAARTGFRDQFHFSRTFKKHLKISPSALRARASRH
jgi:AraC-like DNA-binding protein